MEMFVFCCQWESLEDPQCSGSPTSTWSEKHRTPVGNCLRAGQSQHTSHTISQGLTQMPSHLLCWLLGLPLQGTGLAAFDNRSVLSWGSGNQVSEIRASAGFASAGPLDSSVGAFPLSPQGFPLSMPSFPLVAGAHPNDRT